MDSIIKQIPTLFRKMYKTNLSNLSRYSNLVIDHASLIPYIKSIDVEVTPVDDAPVVFDWKYVGPGDLTVNLVLNGNVLDFPLDERTFAREVILPWLNGSFLKYLGYNLYVDFADVVVNIYDVDGLTDRYVSGVDSIMGTIRRWMPTDKKNSWEYVGKSGLRESVITEQIKKTKSLYLTFPKQGWETIGGYLMKALGIVTGVFTSVDGAIAAVRKKRKNIDPPLKELVIGSHGNGQYLLMGGGKDGYPVDNLLREVSDLVGPETTVFFTACYGGDFLMNLCHASAILGGHEVHGSAGIYNYISNTSQKGFYSCQMSPRDYQDIQTNFEKRNLIFGTDKGNDFLLDKGFCRRESSAPINWAKNIWT